MFFQKSSRQLAGRTAIGPADVTIDVQPPVEVRNTVQYVTLAIPGANQWRSGKEPGAVITAEGQTIRFAVQLETADGERIALTSPAFGQALMFSHVDPQADRPGGASLPRGKSFVRLHLRSSVPVVADAVGWSDITNK